MGAPASAVFFFMSFLAILTTLRGFQLYLRVNIRSGFGLLLYVFLGHLDDVEGVSVIFKGKYKKRVRSL